MGADLDRDLLPRWQTVFDASHSIPIFAILALWGWWRGREGLVAFSSSVVVHAVVDWPTHMEDAHAYLWPILWRPLAGRVSYWRAGSPVWMIEHAILFAAAARLVFERRSRAAATAALTMLMLTAPSLAEPPRRVKVLLEHRQTGSETLDAVQGSGSIVVTRRGPADARAGIGARSRDVSVTRSTGVFTLVNDGGEAEMRMATRVPYEDVRFFQSWANGVGYVESGVAFQDVGTSLRVAADVLPGKRVRVRLTPSISYFAAGGSGAIDLTEAAIDLEVASGEPVLIGGGTSRTNEVVRRILGSRSTSSASETEMFLTATIE